MCYDHFLSRCWADYSSESLGCFTERVYDVLRQHQESLPDRLRGIAPHMIADDWLGSYAQLDNVGRALDGIARRFKRSNPLAGALAEIEANYAALHDDFQRFFPQLELEAGRIQAALVRRGETD